MNINYTTEATEIEKEKTYMGQMTNVDQLKESSRVLRIEQFFITDANRSGSARFRSTNYENFEFTIKLNTKEKNSRIEITESVTEQQYRAMKKLVPSFTIKTRYEFVNENGTKWELDTFPNTNWVRVEIEYRNDLDIPKEFPIDLINVFDALDPTNKEKENEITKKYLTQYNKEG